MTAGIMATLAAAAVRHHEQKGRSQRSGQGAPLPARELVALTDADRAHGEMAMLSRSAPTRRRRAAARPLERGADPLRLGGRPSTWPCPPVSMSSSGAPPTGPAAAGPPKALAPTRAVPLGGTASSWSSRAAGGGVGHRSTETHRSDPVRARRYGSSVRLKAAPAAERTAPIGPWPVDGARRRAWTAATS